MATLVGSTINSLVSSGSTAVRLGTSTLKQLCTGTGSTLLSRSNVTPSQLTQIRYRYIDWRMLRDHKRRQMVAEYGPRRLRLNAVRKNSVIPKDVQEIADREIHAFPRDSCAGRVHPRCMLTSRPRSVQVRWRLSRIMWRHLADYNQLSGVTRAWW